MRPARRQPGPGPSWFLPNRPGSRHRLFSRDRSQAAADFVRQYLLTHPAAGNNIDGHPVTVSASGLTKVYAGAASAAYFGVPGSDPGHPDIFGMGGCVSEGPGRARRGPSRLLAP